MPCSLLTVTRGLRARMRNNQHDRPGHRPKDSALASPDQLAVFEGCTTIIGYIIVENDYAGDFILNGVTEFRGNISTEAHEKSSAQTLGLVQLLNATEIGNMTLYGLIDDVHLPNLQKVGDVVLAQTSPSAEVDLGSLVEASNVKIRGS